MGDLKWKYLNSFEFLDFFIVLKLKTRWKNLEKMIKFLVSMLENEQFDRKNTIEVASLVYFDVETCFYKPSSF
jgi:hypothetical protein